jgi:hypothetical protein
MVSAQKFYFQIHPLIPGHLAELSGSPEKAGSPAALLSRNLTENRNSFMILPLSGVVELATDRNGG